ncbi:mechanosensitive ion channel family protein [Aurantiacibacter gangjinensis]|uniref:Mechanosensitive ion channel protein MscS n=1 Tax=Aurantiacibacter gangjinensis TaxID=502682 RepID=A0A0G9MM99_9SPHN|nr:mechanosensitive ion channel domain-containing protein [Aurantiacibacter gangjinensis]APE27732.1 small-conductance mechanosensitive channel [Aurantiacibacter gangjinensis]KLE31734.1 mechanosensitive ion channel protein MscS [Aurantiacibacter gangjinensis]
MFEEYDPRNWSIAWEEIGVAAIAVALAVTVAYVLFRLVYAVVVKLASRSENPVDDLILARIRSPIKWSAIAIAITLVAQADPLLAQYWEPLAGFLRPALLGWIAYSLVKAFTAVLELRLDQASDPVAVRSRRTRIAILSRTATIAIIIITVGLMLLTIPAVATIGTTLLASAGLAALAIGAAAQPALKSLIAGLQIAITEPLRLGDLVVVDGHTGRVEEIHMAFIIVRTWDERAVVVPTSQILDQSFENWSRKSEKLTGPVMLHLDPIADIGPIRAEFERWVREQDLWDGRTAEMLMTDAYPESIALRLSVSAGTIGELWKLRCKLREHMLDWLRKNQEDALIRHRLEVPQGHPKAEEPV